MFGYIRISKPELKVKEYEVYKSVYCSLCRTVGKKYGIFTRFALSYDFTFLALLNLSMNSCCFDTEQKHCVFNPMKKCNFCTNESFIEMPAAVAMITLYYKICDNIKDEKLPKRFLCRLLKAVFSAGHKKAAENYPEIEKYVKEFTDKQLKLEEEKCRELDPVADPTAKVMGDIFSLCSDDVIQKRILERLGYCVGRFIYILDAACDFEEDRKKGSYNVFNLSSDGDIRNKAEAQLWICINEAAKAFELLEIKNGKNILGNIIYLGLEETFKKELDK